MNKSVFALLFAVVLTACGEKEQDSNPTPMVRLVSVHQASGSVHASYPARTRPALTSNVAFRVSGTLDQLKVKEGDYVREGQVIAVMDDRDYQVQLSATEAEYNQIKADCERIIGLYEDGSTTAQNYDKARYGLEQITAKYQHAKDQVADCQLKAPYNGYIQSILHDSHETVAAGLPILTMFSAKSIEVVINVPASEYVQADRFESFSVAFDVLPGRVFPLRLIGLAQRANANQLYEVRLLLEDDEDNRDLLRKVTPGMTALVDIHYKEEGNASVEVPTGAVFWEDEQCFVYVYEAQGEKGVIHKTPVRVVSLTLKETMHIHGNLKAGQSIIGCGVHHLNDGQEVRPMKAASKENVGGLL